MGFSFTPEEYDGIANHYKDPEKPDRCRWRNLELDVERANGIFRDLEKYPTFSINSSKQENFSAEEHSHNLNEKEKQELNETLESIAVHLSRRSMSVKDLFHDFDKLSSGRVTHSQLRQVLSSVDIHLPDHIFELVCRLWSDEGHDAKKMDTFSYLPFVKQVEATSDGSAPFSPLLPPPLVPKVKKTLMDLNQILLKLKTKVKTERFGVYDFLHDFDPLHSGFITLNEFIRGIDTFKFGLQPEEVLTLAQHYYVEGKSIDYRKFADEMESVFTMKHLEKHPTYTPKPFQPPWHGHINNPTMDVEGKWMKLMQRLTEEARQRRMFVLLRYLEDHDKIHIGTITKAQFSSSLSAAGYCLDEEEADVLFAKYGLEDDENQIDYFSFNEDFTKMIHSASKDPYYLENSKFKNDMSPQGPLIS
ncbi:hypothetical protein HMI56_000768 [Coelomomyces lativittatus]|nr:hypothetical protein HMI56_000768 [Coelomomyces lativittatus]